MGEPTQEYLEEKQAVYETHNQRVLEYFRNRPQDLLVLCWENGDGWEKLCGFLEIAVPNQSIPHCNQGRYKRRLPNFVSNSKPYNALVRTAHWISLTPLARRVKKVMSCEKD